MTSCRGSLAKFILGIVNVFFLALAVGAILVGTRPLMVAGNHDGTFIGVTWRHIFTVLVIVGIIISTISFIGCTGAVCESSCFLQIYIFSLLLAILALIVSFAIGCLFTEQITNEASRHFSQLMANYDQDKSDSQTVILLQKMAMCCGNRYPSDWHNETLLQNVTSIDKTIYPPSCCGKDYLNLETTNTGTNHTAKFVCNDAELRYHDGCFSDLQMKRFKFMLASLLTVCVAYLLVMVSLAFCLDRDRELSESKLINRQYSVHLGTCMGYSNERTASRLPLNHNHGGWQSRQMVTAAPNYY